jgi:hypothetical protein
MHATFTYIHTHIILARKAAQVEVGRARHFMAHHIHTQTHACIHIHTHTYYNSTQSGAGRSGSGTESGTRYAQNTRWPNTHTHTHLPIHTHKYIHTHIIPVCEAQGGWVGHGVGYDNAHSTCWHITLAHTSIYTCIYINRPSHFVPARKAQRAREAQGGERGEGVTGSESRGRARGTHTTLATQTHRHTKTQTRVQVTKTS